MTESVLNNVRNVSFYGSRQQEGHISAIWSLILKLKEKGITVSLERKLADVLSSCRYRPSIHGIGTCSKIPSDCDLAISVGGDGTFLRTARWLDGREIPVMGINTGHLGFLAENSSSDIDEILSIITSGKAPIERRLVLRCEFTTHSGVNETAYALNEAAFLKGAASMIDIEVNLDGFHLASYRADGLIMSTPTGSTAYNLSVGGPIIAPTLQCIVLSPIAPHTLTLRPVVVSANSSVIATVSSREPIFRLSVDGKAADVACGSAVKISKAQFEVLTVRRPGENFASTLRSKLLWGH